MLRLVPREGGEGFHSPSLGDFFPPAIFGDGTFYEFNRVIMVRVIVALVLVAMLVFVARRATVVPTKGQSIVEFLFDFVRNQIVYPVLGQVRGRKYESLLIVIFVSLVAFNITGVIPGLNIASSELIAMPLLLALTVFIIYIHAGVAEHGVVRYAKYSLFPPGVPMVIKPVIAVIDAAQILFIRPASLTVRLMINMVVGHLLLVLCFAATDYFWIQAADGFNIAYGALTFVGGIFITLLELFVALLQAFIFTMLSAVYINMALSAEH
jgi:F-type H+-transporting ATPase subunit a